MKRTLISFDWALKGVLRDKANFGVLSGFLSELLGRDVAVYDIIESESNPIYKGGKTNRLDLKAKINGDEIAIFEIQVGQQYDFFQRTLYGTSMAVVEQLHRGDDYGKIKKVYSIDIVYFELGKGTDYIYHGNTDFRGVHNNEKLLLSKDEMEYVPKYFTQKDPSAGVLFPEYYIIYPKRFDENIKNKFDEWMYALKTSTVKKEFTAAGIQEMGEALDERMMTDSERISYNDYIKYERVRNSEFKSAVWKGESRGERRGLAKGRREGEAKGMAQVFALLEKGLSIEEAKKKLGIDVS